MKKSVCIMAALALCGLSVRAEDSATLTKTTSPSSSGLAGDYAGKFGAGIIIGEPTGLSAKYFLNDKLAVDGAVGWSFDDHTDVYVHGDLLYHKFDLINVSKGRVAVYFGGGVLCRFRDDDHDNEVGVRVPVGISYMFENAPVDIFAEIAPGIDLSPSTRGDITGGIGIRYWF
jgi:hypothetical protein